MIDGLDLGDSVAPPHDSSAVNVELSTLAGKIFCASLLHTSIMWKSPQSVKDFLKKSEIILLSFVVQRVITSS
jgi:hypothetical protein